MNAIMREDGRVLVPQSGVVRVDRLSMDPDVPPTLADRTPGAALRAADGRRKDINRAEEWLAKLTAAGLVGCTYDEPAPVPPGKYGRLEKAITRKVWRRADSPEAQAYLAALELSASVMDGPPAQAGRAAFDKTS